MAGNSIWWLVFMKSSKDNSWGHPRHQLAKVVAAVGVWAVAAGMQAQFHQQTTNGATASGAQTNAAPQSNVDMRGWSYGEMDVREPTVWGRAIFHPNGNFTESKLTEGQQTLSQHTYRAKKQDSDEPVLMQKRLIKLNASGRPAEVLIYDASGRLTNRGVLFYDQAGRLAEERLFDTGNTLVRRKIQTYAANGEKLPLRTFNYGKGLADDVDLMITRESVQKEAAGAGSSKKEKKGFLKKLQFWKKKGEK